MDRQPRPTVIDYVLVAINPGLVMLLVATLVFFLLELAYHGEFPGRVRYIFTLFIFASVLIGRISIEEGAEHAMPFGLALGGAMVLVLMRFGDMGGILSLWFVAMVWWCSHRLTWDCSMIDADKNARGEGLLQAAGLDQGATEIDADDGAGESAPDADRPAESRWRTLWSRILLFDQHRHAPGAGVILFSLLALPLFGCGSLLLPADVGSQRIGFFLFCGYVASALGLLMTTSLLGLRRYLRKRRVLIPTTMASLWLLSGACLGTCVILATMFLPRPNAEIAWSRIPWPESVRQSYRTSRWGVGNEGPKSVQGDPESARTSATKKETGESTAEGDGTPGDAGDGNRQSSAERANESTDRSAGSPSKSGDSRQGQSSDAQDASQAEERDRSTSSRRTNRSDRESPADGSSADQGLADQRSTADSRSARSAGEDEDRQSDRGSPRAAERPAEDSPSSSAPSSESGDSSPQTGTAPPTSTPPWFGGGWASLEPILKWILYGAVALALVYGLIRHWRLVIAAIRDLLVGLREFWDRLWGVRRGDRAERAVVEKREKRPTFDQLADPFLTGAIDRDRPERIVQLSFEALETWAHERGMPRGPDDTVDTFVRQVADRFPLLRKELQRLSSLYTKAAYAGESLERQHVLPLQALWSGLRQVTPV